MKIVAGTSRSSADENVEASASGAPLKRTTRPMVTGSSVIGIRCKDGVILACDTLASYGSMARFRELSRMHRVTDSCVIAASGEYSDFQQIRMMLDRMMLAEECHNDGHTLSAKYVSAAVVEVRFLRI